MIKNFIPNSLKKFEGEISNAIIYEPPLFGLYFTALWCPPCVAFLEKLKKFYTAVNKDKKQFEICICSQDEEDEDFQELLKKSQWQGIPPDEPKVEELLAMFDVQYIPVLIIFDNDGRLIDADGTKSIKSEKKPEEIIQVWLEKSQKAKSLEKGNKK